MRPRRGIGMMRRITVTMGAHNNDFRWNDWNTHQVEKHGLTRRDVEHAVRFAKPPYPRQIHEEEWVGGSWEDPNR